MKDKLENILGPLISFGAGGILATIDVLTSDLPLLSVGLPLYDLIKASSVPKELRIIGMDKKKVLKNYASYVVGAAIPFGIKYFNEIYTFVEGVLK